MVVEFTFKRLEVEVTKTRGYDNGDLGSQSERKKHNIRS